VRLISRVNMDSNLASETPAGSPANPIPLPKEKKVLQQYYAGERLDSPMGGKLDLLGVREGEGGTGRVLLECNTSSLRYVLVIPKATRKERANVKEALEAGDDLFCPRHGPHQRLSKSGKQWACSDCGVPYGRSG
jgi:hypothetical protein